MRERHLDCFGHVNHATYLEILEEARWDLATNRGYGLDEVKRSGLGPVILECNIKYRRELNNLDEIRIETWNDGLRSRVSTIRQEIFRESDGVLVAEAVLTICLFDMKTRRIVPANAKWKIAIA